HEPPCFTMNRETRAHTSIARLARPVPSWRPLRAQRRRERRGAAPNAAEARPRASSRPARARARAGKSAVLTGPRTASAAPRALSSPRREDSRTIHEHSCGTRRTEVHEGFTLLDLSFLDVLRESTSFQQSTTTRRERR